jgi:hypothetical protein
MLLKVSFVLLLAWVVAVSGLYALGEAAHVLLLVGLMLFLIGALKSRDAAIRLGAGKDRTGS